MADLEAVLADVSYLMAMEKSKCTPAARASKKIILPDPRYVIGKSRIKISKIKKEKKPTKLLLFIIMNGKEITKFTCFGYCISINVDVYINVFYNFCFVLLFVYT